MGTPADTPPRGRTGSYPNTDVQGLTDAGPANSRWTRARAAGALKLDSEKVQKVRMLSKQLRLINLTDVTKPEGIAG